MIADLAPRPACRTWLLLLLLCAWLAVVPPGVMAVVSLLAGRPPELLVQVTLLAPVEPRLSGMATGLTAVACTLALHLLLYLPVYRRTRPPACQGRWPGCELVHAAAGVLIAIALYQALDALASLPWGEALLPADRALSGERAFSAALRLALVLPCLLLVPGGVEARRSGASLRQVWRAWGLHLWRDPAALWVALGAAAVVVWPWVVTGSLGSPGTAAANAIQALPNALHEELLFRGIALAWLWRAAGGQRGAALAGLALYIAAQGGAVLPGGDWPALLRLAAALPLGLLAVELTVRAGGSIWPAVALHFLYDWFHLAFVDPRSSEEVLLWLAQAWAPLAAGAVGATLWLGRRVVRSETGHGRQRRGRVAGSLAAGAWMALLALYLLAGAPGFHPDGFLIVMDRQADLSGAASMADPVERRAWVYRALSETALESQAAVRAELERRGVRYRAHYLINAVEVLERPGLRHTFAVWPGVAAVHFQPGMRRYPRTLALLAVDAPALAGTTWNVREIGADQVWALGATGQGVVVGIADTGVAWDHPALGAAYLGLAPDGSVAHDYTWFDAWDGRAAPWPDGDHGTHVAGTVVGRDGEIQVGVAPGARWIGCRNMRHGLGNPGSYLACMEFLFAPFPGGGDPLRDGDPMRGAHVVVNSWGCPPEEGCQLDTLRLAVENLRLAGQMVVVSAGNEGPRCSTVQHPPALYDAVLSVGATAAGDRAAAFSSRGPVLADGSDHLKPDLTAPGVSIVSTVPGGYAAMSGTSAAAPHVAGAVALLWSLDPALAGDVERTEHLLLETAQPIKIDAACQGDLRPAVTICGCGGDGWDSVPNHVYGWGRIDVWAAARALLVAGER